MNKNMDDSKSSTSTNRANRKYHVFDGSDRSNGFDFKEGVRAVASSPSSSVNVRRCKTENAEAETRNTVQTNSTSHSGNSDESSSLTDADADSFLLEPISVWGVPTTDSESKPKPKTRTRTSISHPGNRKTIITPTTNDCDRHRRQPGATHDNRSNTSGATSTARAKTATASPLSSLNPTQVMDYLLQRQRSIINSTITEAREQKQRESKINTSAAPSHSSDKMRKPPPQPQSPPPTVQEVQDRINFEYFMDGRELERNVVVDYDTDRSYVYTTDLGYKFNLPEFLFLDVPNSTFAARACGQYITNKFVQDLKKMAKIKEGHARASTIAARRESAERLAKLCNKSVYSVEDIFVPSQTCAHPYQNRTTHRDSTGIDVPVQAISARFRLRYLNKRAFLHKILRHNFMNSHECNIGIMVFIPIMRRNTHADAFWGSLGGVERLPCDEHFKTQTQGLTNSKMDKWCIEIAVRHGTYRGQDPESMGLASTDNRYYGPFAYQNTDASADATNGNFKFSAQQLTKKPTASPNKNPGTKTKATKKANKAKKHRAAFRKAPPKKRYIPTAKDKTVSTKTVSTKTTASKTTAPAKKSVMSLVSNEEVQKFHSLPIKQEPS